MTLNTQQLRKDFPILERETRPGTRLVYLDSTATSQKPLVVIEAMDAFYRHSNANIHRGVHTLAEEATALYEDAREKIARFINAASPRQVIYTRNTTESINLVAYSWARANLKAGDLVILTEMEHHSNLVPWHILQAERGIELDFIPVTEDGLLDLEAFRQTLLSRSPKLVSFTHMSNVLGTVNPAAEMIRLAHAAGAVTLVDAAQSVPHRSVDVQSLDADFLGVEGDTVPNARAFTSRRTRGRRAAERRFIRAVRSRTRPERATRNSLRTIWISSAGRSGTSSSARPMRASIAASTASVLARVP